MYIFCATVSAVDETGVTFTETGFESREDARSVIVGGIVAEKNVECRLEGSFAIIFLISWINHISSILSASSRTKNSKS